MIMLGTIGNMIRRRFGITRRNGHSVMVRRIGNGHMSQRVQRPRRVGAQHCPNQDTDPRSSTHHDGNSSGDMRNMSIAALSYLTQTP